MSDSYVLRTQDLQYSALVFHAALSELEKHDSTQTVIFRASAEQRHKAMFYSPAIDLTCFNVCVCLLSAFVSCVSFTLSLEDYWTDCMSQCREVNVLVFVCSILAGAIAMALTKRRRTHGQ